MPTSGDTRRKASFHFLARVFGFVLLVAVIWSCATQTEDFFIIRERLPESRGTVLVLPPQLGELAKTTDQRQQKLHDILRKRFSQRGWKVVEEEKGGADYVCSTRFTRYNGFLTFGAGVGRRFPFLVVQMDNEFRICYTLDLRDASSGKVIVKAARDISDRNLPVITGESHFHRVFAKDVDALLVEIAASPRHGAKDQAETAKTPELPPRDIKGLRAQTLDDVLKLPEDQIDIATAALLASKAVDPQLDVEGYRGRIDQMARRLAGRVNEAKGIEQKLTVLGDYVTEQYLPPYLKAELFVLTTRELEYGRLDGVLDIKQGTDFGLSLLYLSLAERLGIPLRLYLWPPPDQQAWLLCQGDGGVRFYLNPASGSACRHRDLDTTSTRVLNKRQAIGVLLCEMGDDFTKKKDFAQAATFYKKAAALNPDDPTLLTSSGRAYAEEGRYEEAARAFKRALRIDPKYIEAWCEFGSACDGMGEYGESRQAFRRAAAIDPWSAQVWWLSRCDACYRGGDYMAALEALLQYKMAGGSTTIFTSWASWLTRLEIGGDADLLMAWSPIRRPFGKILVLPPVFSSQVLQSPVARGEAALPQVGRILRETFSRQGWQPVGAKGVADAGSLSLRDIAALARKTGVDYVCVTEFGHYKGSGLGFPRMALGYEGRVFYRLRIIDTSSKGDQAVVIKSVRYLTDWAFVAGSGLGRLQGLFAEDVEKVVKAALWLPRRSPKGLEAKTVGDVLALSDREIDIGLGALLIEKECEASPDVREYLSQLDRMAQELKTRIGDEKRGKQVVAILNDYLFGQCGYKVCDDDPRAGFLHFLLDEKKGDCLAFSTLYLSLGERLGLPLHGVYAHAHEFVRWRDGEDAALPQTINIETTAEGKAYPDRHYMERYGYPATFAARSFTMVDLTKRQVLGLLLSNLGSCFACAQKHDEALRAYRKAVDVNPANASAWNALGEVYGKQGKWEESAEACRRASAIRPFWARAWSDLGQACRHQNRLDEAAKAYSEALEVKPADAATWVRLGLIYSDEGRLGEAAEAYEKSLGIRPMDARTWLLLGGTYSLQRRFDEAVRAYQRALAIAPGGKSAWYLLGLAYAEQNKLAEAAEACRKSLDLDPKNAQAWGHLGDVYRRQNRLDQAAEAHRMAVSLNSKDPELWKELGNVCYEQGDLDKAIEAWRRALAEDCDLPGVWVRLGAAYCKRKSPDRAVEAFEKALTSDPQSEAIGSLLVMAHYMKHEYAEAWQCVRRCRQLGIPVDKGVLDWLCERMKEPGE